MIPIAEDILRQFALSKRVPKPLHGPRAHGMLRHSHKHTASTVVGEEHQDEQQPAWRCRDEERVGRD